MRNEVVEPARGEADHDEADTKPNYSDIRHAEAEQILPCYPEQRDSQRDIDQVFEKYIGRHGRAYRVDSGVLAGELDDPIGTCGTIEAFC